MLFVSNHSIYSCICLFIHVLFVYIYMYVYNNWFEPFVCLCFCCLLIIDVCVYVFVYYTNLVVYFLRCFLTCAFLSCNANRLEVFDTVVINPPGFWNDSVTFTLWWFNIAMENGPFIDGLPRFTYWKLWFSMAMLNNQMVNGLNGYSCCFVWVVELLVGLSIALRLSFDHYLSCSDEGLLQMRQPNLTHYSFPKQLLSKSLLCPMFFPFKSHQNPWWCLHSQNMTCHPMFF